MDIKIFEKAVISSKPSDLDKMIDWTVDNLKAQGHSVTRYDEFLDSEAFDQVKGYALPVIMVDDEILCAGAYDFTLLDQSKLKKKCSAGSCSNCLMSSTCKQKK